ncbi:MAG: nitroreductase family protein [Zoogloeaceae bacterium]|nr:nitroreductase family protein [Zoogloeaceae bacterium]
METLDALHARKSWRAYSEKPLGDELLKTVVAFANKAPNAGEFTVTVVRNAELLAEINAATLVAMKNSGNDFLISRAALAGYQPLYGAPALALFSAEPTGYYQISAATAASTVAIAATDQGLRSCFIITPTLAIDGKNALSRKLALPEGHVVVCCLLLGYGEAENRFSAPRPEVDNIRFL